MMAVQQVLQLLQAAVARRHVLVICVLCYLPAARQLLTGADAAALFSSLAQDGLSTEADGRMLLRLCEHLRAAEQLPSDVVAQTLTKLLAAPGFRDNQLVVPESRLRLHGLFAKVAALPCARNISAAAAVVVLREGVRLGFDPSPHLVAVQQLGAADVEEVAFAALDWSPQEHGRADDEASAMQLLVQHPAAPDISSMALEELVLLALVQNDRHAFTALASLDSEADILDIESIGRLVVVAAQLDHRRVLDAMPAFDEIGDNSALAALRAALCGGNVRVLHHLLHRLTAAGWTMGAMMLQLLAAAVPLRRPAGLASVAALAVTYGDDCNCVPAAVAALLCGSKQALSVLQHHMHEREWEALLMLAVQLGDEAAICTLCRATLTAQCFAQHQQWAQDISGLAAHLGGRAGISTALEQARERGALLLVSEVIDGLGLLQDPTPAEAAAAAARQRQQRQVRLYQHGRQDPQAVSFDDAARERCQTLVCSALLCGGDSGGLRAPHLRAGRRHALVLSSCCLCCVRASRRRRSWSCCKQHCSSSTAPWVPPWARATATLRPR
jgi:hypothetical protein